MTDEFKFDRDTVEKLLEDLPGGTDPSESINHNILVALCHNNYLLAQIIIELRKAK